MPEQKINLQVESGVKEVVIRHGEAPKVHNRKQKVHDGLINAPADFFMGKKSLFLDKDNQSCPYPGMLVVVNIELGSVTLNCDEHDPLGPVVSGKLRTNPFLAAFKINEEHPYSLKALHQMILRNRTFFKDKEKHSELLLALEKFRASTTGEVISEDDRKGNTNLAFQKTTKLAKELSFTLNIPLFLNTEPKSFKVDVLPDVTDASTRFFLDSADLFELVFREKERLLEKATKVFADNNVTVIHE